MKGRSENRKRVTKMKSFYFAVLDDSKIAVDSISNAIIGIVRQAGYAVTCDCYVSSEEFHNKLNRGG